MLLFQLFIKQKKTLKGYMWTLLKDQKSNDSLENLKPTLANFAWPFQHHKTCSPLAILSNIGARQ